MTCFLLKIKRTNIVFISCIVALFCIYPSSACADDENVIRVGIFRFNGFYGNDNNGEPVGYGYDYLYEVARRANLKLKYVYGSWPDCLSMLENGKIDLLDSVQYTNERAKRFEYSKYSTGISYGRLYVLAGNNSIAYNDFAAMNGMIVGLLKGNSRNNDFFEFSKRNGFVTKTVEYNSVEDLQQALKDGRVDAIVTSNLRKADDEKPIAEFTPTPFYMVMQKKNKNLANKINDALENIQIKNPYFSANLYKKHYKSAYKNVQATKEEQEFINSGISITVAYNSASPPFESYSKGQGAAAGINVDILRLIAEKSGLRFSFVNGYDASGALKAVKEKRVDMLLSTGISPQDARSLGLILSDTYLSTPLALVGRNNVITGSSVFAVSSIDDGMLQFLRQVAPESKIVVHESRAECYKAIVEGKADFALDNAYLANEVIRRGKYGKLIIVRSSGLMEKFSFAFRAGSDPRLVEIVNKGILSISPADYDLLLAGYTAAQPADLSLRAFYQRHKLVFMVLGGTALFLGLAAVLLVLVEQAKNRKALWQMASIDPLTGAFNFSKFKMDAQQLINANPNARFVISKIDIDRFKLLNETFGFAAGDAILKNIATAIKCTINSETDIFAHMSADEFIIFQRYRDGSDIEETRRAFTEKFNAITNFVKQYNIEFNWGRYAVAHDDTNINSIFEKVNYAHREARKNAALRVRDYDNTVRELALHEKNIEDRMEGALENSEFKVFLQAKYRLADEKVIGAEALVRWMPPHGQVIYPNEFIPLFEKNGFIVKLDMYMFKTCCSLMRQWLDEGIPPVPISVNFSKLHLNNPHFVAELCAICDELYLPHRLLEIEITESAALSNEDALINAQCKLHEAGFVLSMDDFGAGYSSLALLKNIPVDVVKLDKEFFFSARHKNKARAVIANVISMARDLEIKTLAEGVETRGQVMMLRDFGCDAVQGYYFSVPLPAETFIAASMANIARSDEEKEHRLKRSDLGDIALGRRELGEDMPVYVYRMLYAALQEVLREKYGEGDMADAFRAAGVLSGKLFAEELDGLDMSLEAFVDAAKEQFARAKIGVLALEQFDVSRGVGVLSIAKDVSCSGMAAKGMSICNYEEGFLEGLLAGHGSRQYTVKEVGCWGNGSELCRFEVRPK